MLNKYLKEIYRSCRPKEDLVSQDEYQSSNVLIGSEVEKFAELIVMECADIFKNVCVTLDGKESLTHEIARKQILRHFGVE